MSRTLEEAEARAAELEGDRNLEKKMRKDAEERAEAAEARVKELEEKWQAANYTADKLTEILGRPTATIGGYAAVTLVEAAQERMQRLEAAEARVKELEARVANEAARAEENYQWGHAAKSRATQLAEQVEQLKAIIDGTNSFSPGLRGEVAMLWSRLREAIAVGELSEDLFNKSARRRLLDIRDALAATAPQGAPTNP